MTWTEYGATCTTVQATHYPTDPEDIYSLNDGQPIIQENE